MSKAWIKKFVLKFRNGMLGKKPSTNMCFIVCFPLQGVLELHGVPTKLVRGKFRKWNHYWLEMADGTVIDPTCDQFGKFPKVYMGPDTHHKMI